MFSLKAHQREPFSSGAKSVAGKPFKYNGHSYKTGDVFDWRKLGVSVRKARQLCENRFINCVPVLAGKPGPKPKATTEEVATPAV